MSRTSAPLRARAGRPDDRAFRSRFVRRAFPASHVDIGGKRAIRIRKFAPDRSSAASMLSPASAHTTSRSMKSGNPVRLLHLAYRDDAAEIDVGHEIAEGFLHREPTARNAPLSGRITYGAARNATTGERDGSDRAREEEERRRARIEIAGLDQPAAQLFHVAGVFPGIMLARIVDQPLRRDLAGVTQRARIVAPLAGAVPISAARRFTARRTWITAITPNASAAADRTRTRSPSWWRPSAPGESDHQFEHGIHVRSGNCTFCT